jgi:predicted nucleotidyltransferase
MHAVASDRRQEEVLRFFAEGLRQRLGSHLRDFILFGSRARGDADPESDYDCLVVVDQAGRAVDDAIDAVAGDTLYRLDAVVAAVPISQAERAARQHDPLLINASREGIRL